MHPPPPGWQNNDLPVPFFPGMTPPPQPMPAQPNPLHRDPLDRFTPGRPVVAETPYPDPRSPAPRSSFPEYQPETPYPPQPVAAYPPAYVAQPSNGVLAGFVSALIAGVVFVALAFLDVLRYPGSLVGMGIVGVVAVIWTTGWLLYRHRSGVTFTLVILAFVVAVAVQFVYFVTRLDHVFSGVGRYYYRLDPVSLLLVVGIDVVSAGIAVFVCAWLAKLMDRNRQAAPHAFAGSIGVTSTGQAVYPIVGYTAAGEPVYGNQLVRSGATNTLAVLALVFGILGGCVAIPLGHIALSQIKRTGEGGRGMAITGLVFGYLWVVATAVWVAVVIGYVNSF